MKPLRWLYSALGASFLAGLAYILVTSDMFAQLVEWGMGVSVALFFMWRVFELGRSFPNGNPVILVWHRHPRIKEGYKYVVKALYFECLDLNVSHQRCADLQDEYGVYKPFQVFFPPKEECDVKVGDLVQPIWRDDKYILCPAPPYIARAC
ncbi:MAG: hypothetical protein EXS52_00170 [Candidatus Staskawiczbacteria bacterium]|nr:hypothetical protein [Candidatus Staskawiczbacteria bacterium]